MFGDIFDFIVDTIVGVWNAIVETWFFVFGILY